MYKVNIELGNKSGTNKGANGKDKKEEKKEEKNYVKLNGIKHQIKTFQRLLFGTIGMNYDYNKIIEEKNTRMIPFINTWNVWRI